MRSLPLSKIISVVGGSREPPGGDDPLVTGISTDSRAIEPGELFIPLSGDRHDGHEFISGAFERGAVASLSSRAGAPGADGPLVRVLSLIHI